MRRLILTAAIGICAIGGFGLVHASDKPKPVHCLISQVHVDDSRDRYVYVYQAPTASFDGLRTYNRVLAFETFDSSAMQAALLELPAGSTVEYAGLGLTVGNPGPTGSQISGLIAFCKKHELALDIDGTD